MANPRRDITTEYYETASKQAGIRARLLRAAGFHVTAGSMGNQVTRVGLVKLTMLTIRGDADNLPPVNVERI